MVSICCAAVLMVLSARSAARLLWDRAPADPSVPGCALTSRTGDAIHLATSAGMAVMLLPLGVPPALLVGLFSATTAAVAGAWALRLTRRRLALRRGAAAPCPPAHALEPHHVAVGLAMIVMAARVGSAGSGVAMAAMAGMTGMSGPAASAGGWPSLSTLSLIYVWLAALVLGAGLTRAAAAQPAPGGRAAVLLAAPVTVYACELTMTVVMGLMLLG
jgi:hypothetical protein